ncbi:MAG TPA: hypothetical protein VFW05_00710 [Verrucomicrobiae bacterium]|nr:hypothetical protein [Verrucomicrobiae bacterium]
MDVHCSTCNEPWDVDHLWNDAVFETGISVKKAEAWQFLPRSQKLIKRYRDEFRAAGWEFGQSVINVIRCPCCPKDAKPNPDRLQTKAALEELLGDDEDGLAATFEDYQL